MFGWYFVEWHFVEWHFKLKISQTRKARLHYNKWQLSKWHSQLQNRHLGNIWITFYQMTFWNENQKSKKVWMAFCRMTFDQMTFSISKQASYKCPEDILSNGNSPNGII